MTSDFSTRFSFDDDQQTTAVIRVVGVGGGGGNAVNNMLTKGIHGVEFVAVNTDAQALQANNSGTKIQMGRELTKGLGAGARPAVGASAAEESHRDIEAALEGCDMVFVTAGMGGGTGTGAAPVVAEIAKKMGILTVAVVTKPFDCEGRRRLSAAENGIQALRDVVDTLIIIPNERLLDIAEDNTTLVEAFAIADDVLYNATRGISELITVHGLINLDFADIKTTMVDGGTAIMGSAEATGEKRAERAAREAISSPLLDGVSIRGARNVLVNITAGMSLGVREATLATKVIQEEAGDDAEVIFGTVIDESVGDALRVTVIATGFDQVNGPTVVPEVTASEGDGEAPRHTPVVLDASTYGTGPQYKGEDNLRRLDTPAYERRQTPPAQDREADASDDGTLRRLPSADVPRRERIRKDDTDVPAFLRRMMD